MKDKAALDNRGGHGNKDDEKSKKTAAGPEMVPLVVHAPQKTEPIVIMKVER